MPIEWMEYPRRKRGIRLNLLFGHDKTVADWVSKKSGKTLREWYHAVGVIDDDGLLCGAATFHDMNGSNAEICFWGPNSARPSIAKGLMKFAFDILKVKRITARTPRQNKTIIKHLPFYGFRCEGVMKHYFAPIKRMDAIVFGLLEADARKFMEKYK